MKKRILGKTCLAVTEIGLGCWAIGGASTNLNMGAGWDGVDASEATKGVLTSVEKGVNLFDTANVYGLGKSERILSQIWTNGVQQREKTIIISKLGYFQGCAEHGYDILNMRQQLEMSLRNLKSDYIDVYFFHHLDFGHNDMYLEGAIEQMQKFKKEGKIRFIGLRGPHKFSLLRKANLYNGNEEYKRFIKLVEMIDPEVVGIRYNMISPTFDRTESDIFEFAFGRNLGIITYKPLGQGLLLDKYNPLEPPQFSSLDHRSRKLWFQAKGLSVLKERMEVIKGHFNISTTEELVRLAIGYCLYKKKISSVLVGFRNEKQISESLSAQNVLTEEDVKYIQSVFHSVNTVIGDFIQEV